MTDVGLSMLPNWLPPNFRDSLTAWAFRLGFAAVAIITIYLLAVGS